MNAEQKKKLSLIITPIIAILALLGCFLYSKIATGGYQNKVNAQNNQIVDYQNKIAVQEAYNNKGKDKQMQKVSGLSLVRKSQDDKIAEKFVRDITTWNNGQQYRKIREHIMKKYNLTDKDNFVKVFMPPLEQTNMKKGNNGTNEIDKSKLNMSFNNMTSYVTDIKGSTYDYFAIISVESRDLKGAVANGKMVMTYTVNGQGKISNLDGYVVGNE